MNNIFTRLSRVIYAKHRTNHRLLPSAVTAVLKENNMSINEALRQERVTDQVAAAIAEVSKLHKELAAAKAELAHVKRTGPHRMEVYAVVKKLNGEWSWLDFSTGQWSGVLKIASLTESKRLAEAVADKYREWVVTYDLGRVSAEGD